MTFPKKCTLFVNVIISSHTLDTNTSSWHVRDTLAQVNIPQEHVGPVPYRALYYTRLLPVVMFKYRFMWFHYVNVFRETIEILKWKERANNIYTFICFWQRRRINKSKWTAFLCLNTSIPMNYEVSVNWNKNVFVLSYKIHWTIWNKNITTSTLFVYYISGTIILTLLSYNKQSSNYVLLLYKDMIFSWKTHKYIFLNFWRWNMIIFVFLFVVIRLNIIQPFS